MGGLLRFIVYFLLIVLGLRYLRSLLRPTQTAAAVRAREGHGPDEARFEGEMVRDPACKAFLSRDRALTASRDGDMYYFCSEACRKTFLEGARSRPSHTH